MRSIAKGDDYQMFMYPTDCLHQISTVWTHNFSNTRTVKHWFSEWTIPYVGLLHQFSSQQKPISQSSTQQSYSSLFSTAELVGFTIEKSALGLKSGVVSLVLSYIPLLLQNSNDISRCVRNFLLFYATFMVTVSTIYIITMTVALTNDMFSLGLEQGGGVYLSEWALGRVLHHIS